MKNLISTYFKILYRSDRGVLIAYALMMFPVSFIFIFDLIALANNGDSIFGDDTESVVVSIQTIGFVLLLFISVATFEQKSNIYYYTLLPFKQSITRKLLNVYALYSAFPFFIVLPLVLYGLLRNISVISVEDVSFLLLLLSFLLFNSFTFTIWNVALTHSAAYYIAYFTFSVLGFAAIKIGFDIVAVFYDLFRSNFYFIFPIFIGLNWLFLYNYVKRYAIYGKHYFEEKTKS